MKAAELLLELMRGRRSIRRFTDQPVSRELVGRLLEAARWAPSNHNRQPWRFIVLADQRRIQRLAQSVGEALAGKLKALPAAAMPFAGELARHATVFEHAPAVIIALHKRPIALSAAVLGDVPNPALVSGEPLSVAMAVQNMLLAAHALGLGTCVMTAPLMVPEAVSEVIEIPKGFELNCFVALGYPAESPAPPRRKNCELIAEYIGGTS